MPETLQPKTLTLSGFMAGNDLLPASIAHHFINRHRNTIYWTVRQRKVQVWILDGVEFVSVHELIRHYETTRPGPEQKPENVIEGQFELRDILHNDSGRNAS